MLALSLRLTPACHKQDTVGVGGGRIWAGASGSEGRARLALADVGPLTPGAAPAEQLWHAYPAVRMPSTGAAVAALRAPENWPDYGSETGRCTPLHPGGLDGQTFEIEAAACAAGGLPVFARGFVTVTRMVGPGDPAARDEWFAALENGLARYGHDEPPAVPAGGEPLFGLELTAHAGHFTRAGRNRLLLYQRDGHAWARAAGTWDPAPRHIHGAYGEVGHDAQHAFWGQGESVAESMLHQFALQVAGAAATEAT